MGNFNPTEKQKEYTHCKHDWFIARERGAHSTLSKVGGEELPTVFRCNKCGISMTAAEAIQNELWRHATGFKKWIAVLALIVSVASLTLSVIALND